VAENAKNRDTDFRMKQVIDINVLVRPWIRLRGIDRNGREVSRQLCRNTLTYAAADVFMNAFLRSGPSQVTHLYARFGGESASQGWLNPPDNDIKATTRDTFLQVADLESVRGALWVPVLSAPAQSTSDQSRFTGNQATFYFRIPANLSTDQQDPDNFKAEGMGSDSFIFGLGLAVAKNISDRSQDVIISVLQAVGWDGGNPLSGDFNKFLVPAGGQMAVDYTVPFDVKP
jgi:hypothetical protein